jgi:hypothetical protein
MNISAVNWIISGPTLDALLDQVQLMVICVLLFLCVPGISGIGKSSPFERKELPLILGGAKV